MQHYNQRKNYSEDKSGRTVNGLKIVIISKERQPEPLKFDDLVYYIRTWLTTWLNAANKPKNKAWIDKVIKHLQKNPDQRWLNHSVRCGQI